jgi:hypothetical protein
MVRRNVKQACNKANYAYGKGNAEKQYRSVLRQIYWQRICYYQISKQR